MSGVFCSGRMKIGVVCDTHNNVKNVHRIVELFNEAQVDRVIHTGDITKGTTLDLFSALDCPLFGVFGNNDVERESLAASVTRHRFVFQDPPLRLRWSGRSILVVHDPAVLDQVDVGDSELVLHGHTHLRREERTAERLIFNPGECAGQMVGFNTIGVVDLTNLEVELLKF
ncbi:MAG: YfcE family phosphodiesterase [Gammaproteobacteria bacterium]|nr:YfcE family phosphodiesterase [Gammaproteobacteria bacterium]